MMKINSLLSLASFFLKIAEEEKEFSSRILALCHLLESSDLASIDGEKVRDLLKEAYEQDLKEIEKIEKDPEEAKRLRDRLIGPIYTKCCNLLKIPSPVVNLLIRKIDEVISFPSPADPAFLPPLEAPIRNINSILERYSSALKRAAESESESDRLSIAEKTEVTKQSTIVKPIEKFLEENKSNLNLNYFNLLNEIFKIIKNNHLSSLLKAKGLSQVAINVSKEKFKLRFRLDDEINILEDSQEARNQLAIKIGILDRLSRILIINPPAKSEEADNNLKRFFSVIDPRTDLTKEEMIEAVIKEYKELREEVSKKEVDKGNKQKRMALLSLIKRINYAINLNETILRLRQKIKEKQGEGTPEALKEIAVIEQTINSISNKMERTTTGMKSRKYLI